MRTPFRLDRPFARLEVTIVFLLGCRERAEYMADGFIDPKLGLYNNEHL
jgi:hypothetical protein